MNKKIMIAMLAVSLVVPTGCSKEAKKDNGQTVADTASEPSASVDQQQSEEKSTMVINGDFSKSNESPEAWKTFSHGGAGSFSIVEEQGVLTVSMTGDVNYGVQLYMVITLFPLQQLMILRLLWQKLVSFIGSMINRLLSYVRKPQNVL